MTHPLVDEVMKKVAVAWLTVDDRPAYGVWCLAVEGALYVVSGTGEQPAPGLATASLAAVTARGDHGGRIVTWPVTVTRVLPKTDEWDTVTPLLAAKRLNSPKNAEATIARWATECAVSRLAPSGDPVEVGDTLPADSGATTPRETPATRRTRRPFRLHRVRRPR
jgi:hypothetical protein